MMRESTEVLEWLPVMAEGALLKTSLIRVCLVPGMKVEFRVGKERNVPECVVTLRLYSQTS